MLQPVLNLINADYLAHAGYLVMTLIIFTETGLLIGFCLPGDSLLITAGIFAARGDLDIVTLNLCLIPAAIIGDTVGYWIGYKTGPHIFNRKKSFLFNPAHLQEAHDFYERHGGKAIVFARFVPIVRTFAPLVAGIGRMNYRSFLLYNVFGGIGWVLSMTVTGFVFGRKFPGAVNNLEKIIIVVAVVSVLPAAIPIIKRILQRKRQPLETVPAETESSTVSSTESV